jgi:branched-chain amino acid transport system substrate-binding protein
MRMMLRRAPFRVRTIQGLAGFAATLVTAGMAVGLHTAYAAGTPEPAPSVKSLTSCNDTKTTTAKIGILAPLSGGGMSADAQDVVNAAQMAINELNAAGGVCGPGGRYKFEIVKADTEGERNDAVVTGFRRLNGTSGLNFVMTGYASTSNFEINLMSKAKMPYLFSANSEQTKKIIPPDPSAFPTVWSRVPDYHGYNTDLPPLLDKLIAEGSLKVPSKTVYIIGSDEPFGATIAQGLNDSFTKAGWKIVGTEKVPFQTVTDWRPQLARIRDAKPGVIVNTNATPASDATFFNQFVEQPTNSLIFLQYAPSIPEFGKLTRNKSAGVVFNMLGGAIDSRSDTQSIKAMYTKTYGAGGYFSVVAYNDVQLYALCINKGNDPTNRLAIGKCIGSLDVETPSGRLAFDPATHMAKTGDDFTPTLFYQVGAGGQNYLISPASVAQAPFKEPYWMNAK